MTVFLAFNEAEALDDPGNAVATTDMAVSGVARAGFQTVDTGNGGSTVVLSSTLQSAQSEAWIHVNIRKYYETVFGQTDDGDLFRVVDDDDNDLANIYMEASSFNGIVQAKSVIDGSYENILSNVSDGELVTYDLHINVASTGGFVKIYANGSLVYEKEGDSIGSTSATGVNKLEFLDFGRSGSSSKNENKTAWGQVLVSDSNTIGAEVYTLDPSAGTTNEWPSGDVTDVDEQGVDDSDQMITDTALDEVNFDSSVTLSALTEPKRFTALIQSYRASLDASASVTGLTPFLETDGDTNIYYASSPSALTTGLAGYQEIWTTDPSDSSNWTAAKINGYQYGYRADN